MKNICFQRIEDTGLTRSQLRVAKYVLSGLRDQEIADKLFVCIKTIKFHTHAIYKKTGVKSRSELIVRYFSNKSIEDMKSTLRRLIDENEKLRLEVRDKTIELMRLGGNLPRGRE